MSEVFKLTIGDWSGDGHERSEDVRFTCNKSVEEIRKGYAKGVKKAGVGLHSVGPRSKVVVILDEFEEHSLSFEIKHKLEDAGVDFGKVEHEVWDGDVDCRGALPVAQLYLELTKVGLPDFTYEIIEDKSVRVNLDSIGYGAMSP